MMEAMQLDLITAKELDQILGFPGIYLIDLRTPDAYIAWHIKGAHNIPYEQFTPQTPLPRTRLLILCCDRGSASLQKTRELLQQNYRVKSLVGGIHSYQEYIRKTSEY